MAVSTPQTVINPPRNVVIGQRDTDSLHDINTAGPARSATERALRITNALQTTLDASQLLETFAQEIKATVPIDGALYSLPEQDLELKAGRNAANSCSYRLNLNEQFLGEITFTRKIKFSSGELNELETLLGSFVHPLRNALLYRTALMKAQRDPLTGVYNRAALNETLAREVELAHRHKNELSLIVIDIDHFKRINDTFGHSAGDCLLHGLVDRARSSIRRSDLLFRFGGEEFVVVLNNTDLKGATRLAERIRRAVEKEEFCCGGKTIRMTVSTGVASLREKDIEATLFARADQALYRAKTAGRNCTRAAE